MVIIESKVFAVKLDPFQMGQEPALHISFACEKLKEKRWQVDWLKAWHVHYCLWQLGCSKEGLLSLRWFPGWDMIPGVSGHSGEILIMLVGLSFW